MILNGNTLKLCFIGIVGTLCLILIGLTIGAASGKVQLTEYEQLLGVLGIPALFGVIVQSFVHSNIADALKVNQTTTTTSATTPTNTPEKVG